MNAGLAVTKVNRHKRAAQSLLLQQAGNLTASSVQNWLGGRILVLESLAQNVAHQGNQADLPGLVDQPAFTSNFQFTYVGQANGVFTQRPDATMPAGYDPRERPWYKQAVNAGQTMLTPPYKAAVGDLIVTIAWSTATPT